MFVDSDEMRVDPIGQGIRRVNRRLCVCFFGVLSVVCECECV
jgi:hypothetical protein